jgi:hypothetical protein
MPAEVRFSANDLNAWLFADGRNAAFAVSAICFLALAISSDLSGRNRFEDNSNDFLIPPFHFASHPIQVRKKVFELDCAYYRKISDHTSDMDHPLSRATYLAMEALQSYVERSSTSPRGGGGGVNKKGISRTCHR